LISERAYGISFLSDITISVVTMLNSRIPNIGMTAISGLVTIAAKYSYRRNIAATIINNEKIVTVIFFTLVLDFVCRIMPYFFILHFYSSIINQVYFPNM
jgi:hypothetical protein